MIDFRLIFLALVMTRPLAAQNVDVYFITGQSNATNLGESSGANGISGDEETPGTGLPFTDVGFHLDVARVGDRTSRDPDVLGSNAGLYGEDPADRTAHGVAFPQNNLDINFRSQNLNNGTAITTLATELYRGNDLGIYTFARGGRPLADVDTTESWYPGSSDITDPANQFDSELYGTFRQWGQDRLDKLSDDGFNPIVRGIFWFQGETDVSSGSIATNAYEENFTNLVTRFREDFGEDVPIVASEIRVTGNGTSSTNARQIQVNTAMHNVAAADSLVDVVTSSDLIPTGGNANDLHLDKGRGSIANQYVIVAERWATTIDDLLGSDGALPCDYVNVGNGCDIHDLNALYQGTNGAPKFSTAAITQWLLDASGDNPAKQAPEHRYVHGDLDLNGNVDSTDLGSLLNNFGDSTGLGWASGNITTDSHIASPDLGALLNNFGYQSPSAVVAVPEPKHLLFFGVFFFYSARKLCRNSCSI